MSTVESVISDCWSIAVESKYVYIPAHKYLEKDIENIKKSRLIEDQKLLVEEFVLFFNLLSKSMISSKKNEFLKLCCFKLLFSAVSSQAELIYNLIKSDKLFQALMLVRPFSEMVDLVLYFAYHPEDIEGFVQANTPEKANKFWHQKVSKGKLKKSLSRRIKEEHKDLIEILDGIDKYIEQETEIHSMSVHPSFTSLVLGCNDFRRNELINEIKNFNQIYENLSLRTLRFSWRRLSQISGLCIEQTKCCIESADKGLADKFLLNERLVFLNLLPLWVMTRADMT